LKQARGRARAEDRRPKALDLVVGRLDVVVGRIGPELVEATLQVAQGSTMAFELGAKVAKGSGSPPEQRKC
jgi:hypothetical protein